MTDRFPILVTGGAGYIGSHTALALRTAGWVVVVMDNLSTGKRPLVPDDVAFIEGDVGDTVLVREILRDHGCRAVMHFAGSIINPESFEIPLQYYANNTSASRNLIEACIGEGVRHFVFSSSAAVYGDPDTLPISETAATDPISPYGRSKLMTEWMLTDAAAVSPMTFAMLRYFNVAGADPEGRSGQVGPPTHLIKIATEAALGHRDGMSIFGDDYDTADGTCIRDYIHVSDLADAHVLALEHLMNGAESLSLNCGYGHGYSVRQVIAAVERVAGVSLNTAIAPRRQGDAATLVADNGKILSSLPWKPNHDDLEFMIQTALDWERR
ncbi:MAG: UDP-glucose 4-epimerase GalE [Proteobacteria bacterium]|nr:UDP-glucose 4-epimerase GalE [Pseudomonadota bacterium]